MPSKLEVQILFLVNGSFLVNDSFFRSLVELFNEIIVKWKGRPSEGKQKLTNSLKNY